MFPPLSKAEGTNREGEGPGELADATAAERHGLEDVALGLDDVIKPGERIHDRVRAAAASVRGQRTILCVDVRASGGDGIRRGPIVPDDEVGAEARPVRV